METNHIDTKALFAPKKGKPATKGQKQIYEGNLETIRTYTFMAGATIAIKAFLLFMHGSNSYKILFFTLTILVQLAAISAMRYMAKAVVSGSSKIVVDGGIDLNLSGGFADKIKDIIITTSACSVLSIFSELFWLLWLWLPAYYIYLIWVTVIGPWIFESPPEVAPEVSEKKRKKLERKMARSGGYR